MLIPVHRLQCTHTRQPTNVQAMENFRKISAQISSVGGEKFENHLLLSHDDANDDDDFSRGDRELIFEWKFFQINFRKIAANSEIGCLRE